ncbi:MAG: hypothetical protein PVI30_20020 [Myxococcales bacterium]|jgi:hypothetical protein
MLYHLLSLLFAAFLLFGCAEGYAPLPGEEALSTAPAGGAAGSVAPTPAGTPTGGTSSGGGSGPAPGTGSASGTDTGSGTGTDSGAGSGTDSGAVASDDCNVDTSLCTMLFECCKTDGTCGAGVAPFCF